MLSFIKFILSNEYKLGVVHSLNRHQFSKAYKTLIGTGMDACTVLPRMAA